MITITIKQCYGNRITYTSSHKTDDIDVAVERAVQRAYGKGRYFCQDYGLTTVDTLYGQIGKSCKTGGTTLVTGRVKIEWSK